MSFWGWVVVLLAAWFALSVLMTWAWSRMPRGQAPQGRGITRWERERGMAAASRPGAVGVTGIRIGEQGQ